MRRLAESRQQDAHLHIRLFSDELEQIKARAKKRGKSLAGWVREMLLESGNGHGVRAAGPVRVGERGAGSAKRKLCRHNLLESQCTVCS